ncbi:serine hydrolase [Microbacterium jejuense]|uniref:serine hydrolase n=1 Tax=Microbacterium jejuense TaxID=1263637 RepID=UPI0031EB343E
MTRRLRIDDLLEITVPSQPALSPDGSRIAYVLGGVDGDADRATSSLWIAESDAAPRSLTRGTADSAPVFSPDGQTLAFLRDGQLWTLPIAGGEADQRTSLALGAGAAVWSPDGAKIAFSAPVDLEASDGESADDRSKRAGAPIVADGIGYQADGTGYLRGARMQVHVLDVASGETRQLTSADAHATSPSWSPDGTRIAFAAKPAGVDDLTYRSAVHVIDPGDPAAAARVVAFADGAAATVAYAPDGERLVVVGWAGDPSGIARLYSVSLATGAATELAGALDRNVMPGAPAYPGGLPQVSAAGEVVFAVRDRGCSHLYAVPLDGGVPRLVLGGEGRVVSGLSVQGGVAAVGLGTPTSFGQIVRVDLASGDEIVVAEQGAAPDGGELFVRESREFLIGDGTTVQGWLLRDPEASGPTPLLVDVHGGPHNAWNGAVDDMHLYHQELVARGWSVLMINPRGSDGYGEEFFTAVDGGWGEADANDFLEPIDRLVADGIADPRRLAIAGYSYGGFMTCYLTSRDDRFAAAVTGGVVSDLTSMGGTSDEAHLLNVFEVGAMPWRAADRERLAAMSPYAQVERVSTPTLVLHGGDDVRCPIGQAEQWHYALRESGVPTRLVIYPGGSHIFPILGTPSHRLDYNRRIVDWVEQYAGDAAGARPAAIDVAHWQRRLGALAKVHKVPGAQLGILRVGDRRDDEIVTASHGTLNRNISTGAPVTKDSIFQIGSISKVWTATVVMRLIEHGELSLDTKVKDVVPELELIDDELTDGVTIWHLLTHTSGIDGDVFTDTGRGDDALEKYTAELRTAGQNHPLGATWSYCNSGFSLLGRVIEKITGKTWDAAMAELLFQPLGLTHTVTLPDDAIRYAAAVGHVDVAGEQVVTPAWGLMRSVGPAGLITARAEDVLAFARLHMAGGVTADGTRLLSEDAVGQMQAFQAEVPDKHVLGDSWGLGWIRFDWNGERLYGHDGNTIGQAAFLRIHGPSGLAVTLLTNGGNTRDLYESLYREIFAELAGIDMKAPVAVPDEPVEVDIAPFVGTYERASVRMEVLNGDDGPILRSTVLGPLAELEPNPTEELPMVALGDRLFAVRAPGTQTWITVTFYALPTGEEYVHFGARATPKVSDAVSTSPIEDEEKVAVPA